MSTVVMHNVVSVDGYIADLADDVGPPPAGDHVVVVSHRPKPDGWHPEASDRNFNNTGW
jgi:hypothetical protein